MSRAGGVPKAFVRRAVTATGRGIEPQAVKHPARFADEVTAAVRRLEARGLLTKAQFNPWRRAGG